MSTLLAAIPNILKAALILLLAYVIAVVLRMIMSKAGTKLMANDKVRSNKMLQGQTDLSSYPKIAGEIVFYLVLLLFLPGVLDALNIESVSPAVQPIVIVIPWIYSTLDCGGSHLLRRLPRSENRPRYRDEFPSCCWNR